MANTEQSDANQFPPQPQQPDHKFHIKKWEVIVACVVILIVGSMYSWKEIKRHQFVGVGECNRECVDELLKYSKIADWQTYRNDEYGFEFRYPRDWVMDEATLGESGGNIIRLIEPREIKAEGMRISIAKVDFKLSSDGLSSMLSRDDTRQIITDQEIYFANIKAREVVFEWAGIKYKTILLDTDPVIMIELKNTSVSNQILSTFKFIEPIVSKPIVSNSLFPLNLKNIPVDVQSNQSFVSWYSSKKAKHISLADFSRYFKDSPMGITSNKDYDGGAVCQGAGFKSVPSLDDSKIACVSDRSDSGSDLSIYNKAEKFSGRLQACRTCSNEDGFWLDNDRFIFLSDYEDKEFITFKGFIIVQQYDFKNKLVNAWSAGIK